MADVIYKKGQSANLDNVTVADGQILVTEDIGEMYVDMSNGKRKKITDTDKQDKIGEFNGLSPYGKQLESEYIDWQFKSLKLNMGLEGRISSSQNSLNIEGLANVTPNSNGYSAINKNYVDEKALDLEARINLSTLESTKATLLNSSDFSYIMSKSKNMQIPGISTITFGNGVYSGGAVELQPSQVLLTEEPTDWGTGLNTYYYINDKGKYAAVNQQNNQWEENKYYINKNPYVSCAMNSKEANGIEITPPAEMSSHVFGISFSQCYNPVVDDEAIGLAYKVTIKSQNENASEITAKPTLAGSLNWGNLGSKDNSILGTYALIKSYVIENKKPNPSMKIGKEYTSFIDWYNDETCDILYTSCQQASGVHMPSSTKEMSYYVYIPFDNVFNTAPYIRACEDSIVEDIDNVTFKLRCAGMNAGFDYIKFSNLIYITDTKDTTVNSYEYKISVDASNYKNSNYGLFDTVVLNNDGKIVYEEPQLIADQLITSSYQTDLVMSKDTFVFSGMPKRTKVWQMTQHTGEQAWYWEYRVYGYVFGVNLVTANGTTKPINTSFSTIIPKKEITIESLEKRIAELERKIAAIAIL